MFYRRLPLKDLLVIIRPHSLQPLPHFAIIPADMLAVPPITATIMIRKRRLQALEGQIRRAHDCLPHVIEAVNHVPVVVFRQRMVRLQAAVDFDDGEEAVQLVGHGGCEDGLIGPDDGRREVVVGFRVRDRLETHADRHELVPGLEGLGLEELGGVVRGEGLVDLEGRYLGRDCVILAFGTKEVYLLCRGTYYSVPIL